MTGNHLSLFSGVGMTDLAASRVGFTTVATAEIDPWCRTVLRKRFPNAMHFRDVRKVDAFGPAAMATGLVSGRQRPLLVSGGFPCQDLSIIGGSDGLKGKRSGLYVELMRVVREFQPEYVLIENVAALRVRGLGLLMFDLFAAGYDATWDCIPAAAVGAPHVRDRCWIAAVRRDMRKTQPLKLWQAKNSIGAVSRGTVFSSGHEVTKFPRSGNMDIGLLSERKAPKRPRSAEWPTPRAALNEWRTTKNAPSHSKGSHGATLAGLVNEQERAAGRPTIPSDASAGNVNPMWVEWLMGLPLGWTDPGVDTPLPHAGWDNEPNRLWVPRVTAHAPHRANRLKALGNGLVPQVAQRVLEGLVQL